MKKIIILFFLFIIFKISLAQTGTVTITPTYSVCLGTVVTMTASGFVAPTITRWETSPNNNPPWTAIASSNSPTITVTASASLYYRAVATTGLAATNSALLTINQPSAGTVSSNATVCSGINSGTLTLSGTFTSVNFWEYSIDGGNTWTPISNTTTSQNYLNLTTYTQYRVDMTNGICPSAKATPAIITVNPTSIGGTAAGTATVCSGSNGGTLLLSGYSGSVIKWQSSTDGDITWTNITNITNTNNYSNITQTTDYRAVVQSGTCASANSSSATISVSPVSDGGTISGAASVCSGANNGTLTLSGQTGTILNWSSSIDGGNTWTPIANTTSSQNYSNLIATTMYLATVQNGSCASANSTSATITVSPGSIGGIVLGATSTCAGSNNGTLTLSGYTGNIVRWQSSVDGGITWANITNTSAYNNYSNLAQTTDFRAVVQNGICAAANSSIARITIVPISDGGTVNSNATVCSGANNGTLQLINYTGTVAQWEKSTDNGFNWNIISNGTDTLSYSNLTIKTLFRALVQSGTCTANYSTPATITINSLSVGGIISGADTICSGSNSGNLILSGYFGSIVRWQSSTDGGVSWNNISNTTAIYNYVNIVTTTNYRAVIQNGGCPAANSADAIITVFPVSAGGNLSPAAFSACNGINNGTIILSGHSGNIIKWQSSIDGGVTWMDIANTSIAQDFQNLTATTIYRAVVQNGQCAPAYSAVSTITASPQTVGGTVSGNDTVCTGTNNGSLVLNGFTGSILYWEKSIDGGLTWTTISNTTAMQNYSNLLITTMYHAVVQSGSCATANSASATILVYPATIGGSVLGSKVVCDSSSTGLLTLFGHTGNILRWEKSFDSGITWTPIVSASNTISYSGIKTVTMFRAVVQSGICVSAVSAPATVSLSLPVQAAFTDVINGATVIFTNTSNGNIGTSAWDFGDGTTSATTNTAHNYIANGTYLVKLIVADSCGSDTTAHIVTINGVGIKELSYNNPEVKVFPNPSNGVFNLQMNKFENVLIKIYDILGECIYQHICQSLNLQIDLCNSPRGIYFYTLQSQNEIIATGKIVKE